MMRTFDENLIQIKKNEVLGKLPNLFTMEDGSRVETPEQWKERRKELYKTAVELQYGEMPPEPEFLEVEPLDENIAIRNYRIVTGTRQTPTAFTMRVIGPNKPGVFPAIVDGDLCWRYAFDKEYINAVIEQDVLLVMFNRTEIVPDRKDCRDRGQLYRTYPDGTFSALAAWAWGYSRCVDALQQLGIADMNHIAFSGHSRGGKTALLAGVLDERAAIVNPNDAGAGGAGCYRVHMEAVTEEGEIARSEQLSDLIKNFPFWFSKEMQAYTEIEEELPFDEHYLKALVAPRMLLETEAASDIWANPVGSVQTCLAAKEVYKLLGAEENIRLYYRKGVHAHEVEDMALLVRVLKQRQEGKPYEEGSFKLPFVMPEPIYDFGPIK